MSLKKIDTLYYNKVRELYFLWKNLNKGIKEDYTRGINLPEAITEPICCYVNDYFLSTGGGSEDAVIPLTGELVQIKATSNFNSDLTSFGPNSNFKFLHFVRLNQDTDTMYLYNIPIDNLYSINVNSYETFKDQQNQGRRPRFSIISMYIEKYNIQPYAIVNLVDGNIER